MNGSVILRGAMAALVSLGALALAAPPAADGDRPSEKATSGTKPGAGRLRGVSAEVTRSDATGGVASEGRVAGVSCSQPEANCQAGDPFDAYASDRARFLVADDFTPVGDGDVSSLCWWGAYGQPNLSGGFDDCQGLHPDSFELTYYENAGGIPGAAVATFSQLDGTLTVAGPVVTGGLIADALPEYAFTATHAPVSVVAGQCYWVMITNLPATDCFWFWELGLTGNGQILQDGDGVNPPDGFALGELFEGDMAMCLDVGLGDATTCLPPRPANDACVDAEQITGTGLFAYDNRTATTDGLREAACFPSSNVQLEADVWYCWTAPCTDTVLVSSCSTSTADSLIAVYDGCGACPPTGDGLLNCNDDLCGDELAPRQSMAVFDAVAGQTYTIRVGTFPSELREAGAIEISCGPPDVAACVPGTGDCCDDAGTGSPACADEFCCELVCACDPYCCEVEWDETCSLFGFQSNGCGAARLCEDRCDPCGTPEAGDCCSNNGTRGCSDATCCDSVCACDAFCCDVVWDENCATFGFEGSGCGAAALCETLCTAPECPSGEIVFVDPPDGVVDARQPHPPGDAGAAQGVDTLFLTAPAGADADCFSLCETAHTGTPNAITRVSESSGAYTVRLARPITPAAATTLTYTDNTGLQTTATYMSHPGNVNGDSTVNSVDLVVLTSVLTEAGGILPWGLYSGDMDQSGTLAPGDVLRVIDLFNGADQLDPALDTPRPSAAGVCPEALP